MSGIPEWFGAAILGAILAALGYVGKETIELVRRIRADSRARRARLAQLLAYVRAGDAAFQVQCDVRDRLAKLIVARSADLAAQNLPYDQLFQRAHATLPQEEQELFAIVRAITQHTLGPLNESMLAWLSSDTDFRVNVSGSSAETTLAKYLADLEAHLLLWRAKYNAWIPSNPDRALVYLADENRHGLGFPPNGTSTIQAMLNRR